MFVCCTHSARFILSKIPVMFTWIEKKLGKDITQIIWRFLKDLQHLEFRKQKFVFDKYFVFDDFVHITYSPCIARSLNSTGLFCSLEYINEHNRKQGDGKYYVDVD